MGALSPGTVLSGTYRIIRRIAHGGMGDVYEATHARLAGRYAVKLLLGEVAARPDVFARFRREAEVTSGLRHPNIVNVIDFNQTDAGEAYLVMEYLDGISLGAEIERIGWLPLPRVLDIVRQVSSALAAAHARGIVHRDLKPENLLLLRLEGDEGETVKVVDFGISKVREEKVRLTQQRMIMGTPQYMSPEQALGRMEDIDDRADQFALAVITYEMLAGRPPFRGDDVNAVLFQVVNAAPAPLATVNAGVPPAVQTVVEKALSKVRDDRYPGVLDFHRELARAAAGQVVPTVLLTPPGGRAHARTPELAATKQTTFGSTTGEMAPAPTIRTRRPARRGFTLMLGAAAGAAAMVAIARRFGSKPPPGPAPPSSDIAAPATVAAPAPPATSLIELEHLPTGAQISVDGILREAPITVPRGSGVHRVRVVAPGHEPFEVGVDATRERHTVVVTLKPLPAPAAARAEPRPPARVTSKPARSRPPRARPPAPPPEEAASPAAPPKRRAKIITDI